MGHKKTIIDFKGLQRRLIFTNPIQELIAETISDVKSVLAQVEKYQKKGYFVVGYLSYEASKAFESRYQVKNYRLLTEKLAYFTVHDSYQESLFPLSYDTVEVEGDWKACISESDYQRAISKVKTYIRNGDTYQVNFTFHMENEVTISPQLLYERMVVEQEALYNAYIETDDFTVLSFSPELFFEKTNCQIITKPMKGTVKRGVTLEEDLNKKIWLSKDTKNRAENMMIVDLLRNDMSRISKVGSVKVKKLCEVEQYSTVWQMTSTIESVLEDHKNLIDIFEALYPCGSITGAPKISTMSIIDEVENMPRGVYCGSIGICFPNGDLIFNVAIRTIQLSDNRAIYGVGGGITWYSDWEDEYEETKAKSQILYRKQPKFSVITTGRIENAQLLDKERHYKRLVESCRYFNFPLQKEVLDDKLNEKLNSLDRDESYKIRISVFKSGNIECAIEKLKPLPQSYLLPILKERKLIEDSPFYYFKTSNRLHIPYTDGDVIFYSENGVLQESRIGNLVLEIDGSLYTPKLIRGCLNGIYRQKLLEEKTIIEKTLTLKDLQKADKTFICNAVRGMYEVEWSNHD